MDLYSVLGWMKTPAGNRFAVKRRWGIAGDWIWYARGHRGTATSYEEAVLQATNWADHPAGRLKRTKWRGRFRNGA